MNEMIAIETAEPACEHRFARFGDALVCEKCFEGSEGLTAPAPGCPTDAQRAAAAELRESRRAHLRQREESFARCDTDGFLSQWADGLSASLCDRRAEILEAGGYATFSVLLDGDRRVDAKQIRVANRYRGGDDAVWRLADAEEARYGRRFVPVDFGAGTSRVQKKLGLHEGREFRPAWAKIGGSGTGLSGTAFVMNYPVDALKEV